MRRHWFLLGFCALFLSLPSRAQHLVYSADITLDIAGSPRDHDYIRGAPGAIAVVGVPGLPDHADLDALHVDADGSVLFSLDVTASLGGIVAHPGDVIRHHDGNLELVFDASASGVSDGANCDAVARDASGRLLLSFDRSVAVGGLTIYRADVVAFDGGTFVKVLDSGGIADALDVDAVHAESATTLLLSFDTGGTVGGVAFADEDILALNLDNFVWTLRHELSSTSGEWHRADLDALAIVIVGDLVFSDSFE